ncbi:MAG: trypsin-like serine protease [Planctomycetia bacterium]
MGLHSVATGRAGRQFMPLALVFACLGSLAAPSVARAVLIQTATGTGNTTAPPDDPGWANVGVRGIGNGVYLGGGWVLTVAHVGAGDIVLGGATYSSVPGSAVQLTNGGASGRSAATDLMLYRLATEPVGLAPVTIAATQPPVGTAVTMIGSGLDRGAFTEWSVNSSVTPWVWAEVDSGGNAAGYKTAGTRQMRWGTNTISATDLWITASDLAPPLDVRSIGTEFDAQFGTSEAQAVNHDSGGAVFAKPGGAWELAGMIFDVGGYSGQPSPAFNAVIGNATYSVDLSYYRPQIMAIVPEPSTGPLATVIAGLALAGSAAARSRRSSARRFPHGF